METVRRILYPTRFEPLALAGLRRLFSLRKAGLEEILLLFVVDREEVAYIPFGGFDRKLSDELSEHARLRFLDWEEEIRNAGLEARHFIEVGRPASKILEVSAREKADLIATGGQRQTQCGAVSLGATILEVLRRSRAPVLVGKEASEPCSELAGGLFERVVLATDFTEVSEPALSFVGALRGAVRDVAVVHVVPERDFDRHSSDEIRAEEGGDRTRLEQLCAELRTTGLNAEPHERAGEVVAEILGAAEDTGAQLIVMGTTEKEALIEFFLGSLSHRAAELSTVPVLLVPARSRE